MEDETVTHGSSNVFADLGHSHPEEHQAKVDLAIAIKDWIRALGLTQEEVAKRTGLSQADVSKVTRGLVRGFTFDRLFRILGALDRSVLIRVEALPAGAEHAHMTVQAVAAVPPPLDSPPPSGV